jgi:hypothetical protein
MLPKRIGRFEATQITRVTKAVDPNVAAPDREGDVL